MEPKKVKTFKEFINESNLTTKEKIDALHKEMTTDLIKPLKSLIGESGITMIDISKLPGTKIKTIGNELANRHEVKFSVAFNEDGLGARNGEGLGRYGSIDIRVTDWDDEQYSKRDLESYVKTVEKAISGSAFVKKFGYKGKVDISAFSDGSDAKIRITIDDSKVIKHAKDKYGLEADGTVNDMYRWKK